MRVFPDFQDELINLDSRITVNVNSNNPKLANIMLDGIDICNIPNGDIRELPDPGYTIEFPNGYVCKHRSRQEALAITNDILERIKTPEGKDYFYSKE